MLLTSAAAGVPALTASYSLSSTTGNPCSFNLLSTGILQLIEDATTEPAGQWLTVRPDSTTAALYSVRRTQITGTLGITYTGTMTSGTWYPLSSDRGVQALETGIARSNNSTWEIALTTDLGTILATADATVTSNP